MRRIESKDASRPDTKPITKAETGFLTTRKNPYHEMLIMAEAIRTEKKKEGVNAKNKYTFNPYNSIIIADNSLSIQ